jgi:hypothetical protein
LCSIFFEPLNKNKSKTLLLIQTFRLIELEESLQLELGAQLLKTEMKYTEYSNIGILKQIFQRSTVALFDPRSSLNYYCYWEIREDPKEMVDRLNELHFSSYIFRSIQQQIKILQLHFFFF